MEMSENDAMSSSVAATTSRRKSGRAVKAPEKFVPSQAEATSAKRKRGAGEGENDASDEDDEDEDSEEPSDESAAEEEAPKARKKAKAPPRMPAAKRPKVNGSASHADEDGDEGDDDEARAVRLPSRPKKGKKVAIAKSEVGGLYAEVYTSGKNLDDVAAEWFTKCTDDVVGALADIVNFILKSAGCEIEVTNDDIEDVDNIEQKITDIQEEFQATNPSDYPLASKAKSGSAFRACLTGFFHSIINTIHKAGVLYETDEEGKAVLLDTLITWATVMSSAHSRAIRHTATLVNLTINSAICDVASEIMDVTAKALRQAESEKAKKGRANKGRLAEFQAKVEEGESYKNLLQATIKDNFDTVFVHRYRDVDPKIRTECVEALGYWMLEMPDVFFEGTFLRYLGWMLSDVNFATRHAAIKQLIKILKKKDNLGGMRHFIERFRPRLVEIASRDSEPTIRASCVELVDILRDAGMLEPNDIDSIGKLIFDADAKVRKAVVPFFTESIKDSYEVIVEELGGEEALEEILIVDDEDFDSPRAGWIKLKALAEILLNFDTQDREDMPSQIELISNGVNVRGSESRFTCAAQALYDQMPELRDWEVLSGYLLFDHSAKGRGSQIERNLKEAFKPEEAEEIILLDILNAVVKLNLTEGDSSDRAKDKSRKAAKLELLESKETTARHLAETIPRLLKKFGASPRTATVVLRLEHTLNLDVFQELRQDSTAYAKLLDEISAQFSRHADKGVINEAGAALLRARGYEDLEEVTEQKMQSLWESTTDTLRRLSKTGTIGTRGGLRAPVLRELSHNLARLEKLASISNCVEALEANSGKDQPLSISILLDIVGRGELSEADPDTDFLEDQVVTSAVQSAIFYFMWKVQSIMKAMEAEEDIVAEEIDEMKERRETFLRNLVATLSSRATLDPLRLLATSTLLDIHTLFASIYSNRVVEDDDEDKYAILAELSVKIPADVQTEILSIFDASERNFAKKAQKTLAEPGEDEEPEDVDSDSEDDSVEDETTSKRQAETLKAEQQLCELTSKMILATFAKVLTIPASRLKRNKLRLGPNFKQILEYLDDPAKKASKGKKAAGNRKKQSTPNENPARTAATGKKTANKKLSDEVVGESEDEGGEREEDSELSEPEVEEAGDEEEEDLEPEPEEGTREDLKKRELVDDDDAAISLDGDASQEEPGQQEDENAEEDEDDDDPMGD
ncbi:STAG domain-containing protein [Phlyctema vagabunda]|uniref:STAG domain-containing protein n=1 Tax=Phlyctema vagabunda TaxID=108571 RepID=A0ABR4P305_9HELO